ADNAWFVEKFLKIFYAASALMHRLKIGAKDRFVIISNFDRTLKLKINTSWSMGFALYWSGFHEFHEFLFLNKFLKKDMVFVDIGANLGEYSLFAARRLSSGKVLAFEPMPKMYALLEENRALNQFENITIFKYGLSAQEAILPIHEIENAHEGLSTFFPGDQKSRTITNVPLKVFDAEMDSLGIERIDFVKIDIEGSELNALKGAKKSIQKFKPVVMVEINQKTYGMAGYSVEDMFSFFAELSYTPFEITRTGRLKATTRKPVLENIVFKPV
ncbi:MAG TPA: FkbM family methyltransferase, partial [Cyclobacteriaceae bacterium]|nr:FkbM family methyltransferase [Cyclobacteriaceae bacterium]